MTVAVIIFHAQHRLCRLSLSRKAALKLLPRPQQRDPLCIYHKTQIIPRNLGENLRLVRWKGSFHLCLIFTLPQHAPEAAQHLDRDHAVFVGEEKVPHEGDAQEELFGDAAQTVTGDFTEWRNSRKVGQPSSLTLYFQYKQSLGYGSTPVATPEKVNQDEEDVVVILDDEDDNHVGEVDLQGPGAGDSWVGVVATPGQKAKKKVVQVKVEDESEVSALKTLGFRVCSWLCIIM